MNRSKYKTEPTHRNSRRCIKHDYLAPGIYLITANQYYGAPPMSRIHDKAQLTLTPLGEAIHREIYDINRHHPEIVVYQHVVMPDHIHIVLHVVKQLSRHLGQELAGFFGACSRHWQRLENLPHLLTLFQPFHDRILLRQNQLQTMKQYVADNPKRLAIKRRYPDLFQRYSHIEINGMHFAAFGNIFLLRDFDRQQVVVHRADSQQTRQNNYRTWMKCAANGGVLISPFISPDEKRIYENAEASGGRFIIICKDGFPERFKPAGAQFELCAQGRLLLLAPWPDNLTRSKVTRWEAMEMNRMAAEIAAYTGPICLKK